MTAHLLVLSIGPVQDFITAARRTRDLWFGSFLLSEISKAAARAVKEAHGQLIFPAPENPAALNETSELNVANVILAELSESLKPEDIRQAAYDAAQKCWKGHAEAARIAAKGLVEETIWADQIDDVIEFYAAWTSVSPSYKEARERVMHLLAGRKACRNFIPAKGLAGIPKSSLDGARETVLFCGKDQRTTRTLRRDILQQNRELAQRLRLSAGEELNIIGLTKRAATKETFPSIVRAAADPWIRGIQKRKGASNLLEQVADKCRDTGFATRTGNYYQGIFPYDGAVLYPSRLASMLRPPCLTDQISGILMTFFPKVIEKS
jgi:CRISPR-associated protein Cmr2